MALLAKRYSLSVIAAVSLQRECGVRSAQFHEFQIARSDKRWMIRLTEARILPSEPGRCGGGSRGWSALPSRLASSASNFFCNSWAAALGDIAFGLALWMEIAAKR